MVKINGEMILNEEELALVSGGKGINCTTANVVNYYLSCLPFVNKDHIQITESSSGWQDVPGNPDIKRKNVVCEAVRSDMKWNNLSGKEKLYVITPVAGAAFVAAGVLIPAVWRYAKKRLNV